MSSLAIHYIEEMMIVGCYLERKTIQGNFLMKVIIKSLWWAAMMLIKAKGTLKWMNFWLSTDWDDFK